MRWTTDIIKELCVEYCGKCGVEFQSPVVINNCLTRTLGRCIYTKNGSVINPMTIEISRQLLETSADESIKDIIMHECAHYVVAALTHEIHGHDAVFKKYCAIIGTTNDTIYADPKRTTSYDNIYKYTIYCSKCGKFVGGRSRASKVIKMPENFYTNCCNAELKISQNW